MMSEIPTQAPTQFEHDKARRNAYEKQRKGGRGGADRGCVDLI